MGGRKGLVTVKTMFLSLTELEAVSRFWDLYVKRSSGPENLDDPLLKHQMDQALSVVSEETRETFLASLDRFELQGEEFEVRIAPDDAKLVSA